MAVVSVPLALLLGIVLIKKIPWIGGDIRVALLAAGLSAGLLSRLDPMQFLIAAIDGLDQLSWIIMLSVFGSIYAETQVRLGAMTTTLKCLRAIFGGSPKGLVAATLLTLVLAGSLLGDAIAAATVIGFLVIHSLSDLQIKPVQIGMIILLGASLGSIMPPISQAVFLASSIVDTNPAPVVNWAYLTVGVGVVLAVVECFRFVHRRSLPPELRSKQSFFQVIRGRWQTLVPLFVLALVIIANTGFHFDVFSQTPGLQVATSWLQSVPILKGLAFPVVMAIVLATLVSFLFKPVRRDPAGTVSTGFRKVSATVQIQLSAAFMIGVFYASGAIQSVTSTVETMNGDSLKLVGAAAIVAVGMLTGSQTSAQTVIMPFLAPILEGFGVNRGNIALGASHIAAAGQNMPPVGLTAFVVCGLVGAALNVRVNPLHVMMLALPNSLYFLLIGTTAWFL